MIFYLNPSSTERTHGKPDVTIGRVLWKSCSEN